MSKLSEKLENHFKPLGIVAFSFCCHPGCTGTYDEYDSSFEYREKGIYFIRLHLGGMNFYHNPIECFASYSDFDYLIKNWQEEENILIDWCRIIGLSKGEYKIIQPKSKNNAITIRFEKELSIIDEFKSDEFNSDEFDSN